MAVNAKTIRADELQDGDRFVSPISKRTMRVTGITPDRPYGMVDVAVLDADDVAFTVTLEESEPVELLVRR